MSQSTRLEPSAAYEHAHLIARDLLDDIRRQLDSAVKPDDANLRWRHVHGMNRVNAQLSEIAMALDELNMRNR